MAARTRSSAASAAVLASALAGAVAASTPAARAETVAQAERHRWELRLLAGDWYSRLERRMQRPRPESARP